MNYTQGIITTQDLIDNSTSGLFLDQQLACDSLCWTLSAQTLSENSNLCNESSGYEELLLRGLITDESPTVEFSVNHSYSDPFGNTELPDKLFNIVRNVRRTGDVIGKSVDALARDESNSLGTNYVSDLVNSGKELLEEGKTAAINAISKGDEEKKKSINEALNKVDSMTRGSLMSGIGKSKYYDTSNISIKIPQIEFRYYHGMYRKSSGEEVSVRDLINYLNNRLIGKYNGSNPDGTILGIMESPNGFLGTGVDIVGLNENRIIQGTFCLEYSGRRIPNLICTNYEVKLSTTRLMDYKGKLYTDRDSEGILASSGTTVIKDNINDIYGNITRKAGTYYEPLYADISISLEPVAIYTRDNINQIMAI